MASGAMVRDRKKESFWQRHSKAQAHSELSVAAYCRRHGLREYGFYWWRRELSRRDAAVPAAFVPVRVTAELPAVAEEQELGGIEIVLAGDWRVRVTGYPRIYRAPEEGVRKARQRWPCRPPWLHRPPWPSQRPLPAQSVWRRKALAPNTSRAV